MDTLTERLVAILRRDARRPVAKLAADLGVSRATVRNRLERLEQSGELVGYTAVLRSDIGQLPIRGLMLIAIEGHMAERVIARLNGMTEVSAIHTTNGKWDLIVELGAETLAEFDDILRRIRLIEGISASETNLLLATRRSAAAWN
ncbi:Lrp/AsnC family transcriptional regulator [Oceanomicrobium pacificus]|uniref:AsnC family transcriptional regulator n=1 Tax=Oceanomicrobium pacificus TaxID=2692916 RepID=A0A6B0THV8_9RHOB|nr:Lrp/AsnC family transcriptional regulator [Oceanomicrobium pacificus]MXU63980.1 AsnC family transcriptional regulator [Oceanomicrobium pacificus]